MSRGGRRTQPPPPSQRRSRIDVVEQSTTTGTGGTAQAYSGAAPLQVSAVQEVPAAQPRQSDGFHWKQTTQVVSIAVASIVVVLAVVIGAYQLTSGIESVETKVDKLGERVNDVAINGARNEVQLQQVQSTLTELRRELRPVHQPQPTPAPPQNQPPFQEPLPTVKQN
jgi:hypothetical protein